MILRQVHDIAVAQSVTVLIFELVLRCRTRFFEVILGLIFFVIIILIKHEFLNFSKLEIGILTVSRVLAHVS